MATFVRLELAAERYQRFARAFEGESDRGVAILSMCVLEESVRESIGNRLGPFSTELIETLAPKGSWHVMSKIAAAFGLISQAERADLKHLVNVRNRFAHVALDRLSFDDPSVNGEVKQLTEYKRMMRACYPDTRTDELSNRALFLHTVYLLYATIATRMETARPLVSCKELDWTDGQMRVEPGGW